MHIYRVVMEKPLIQGPPDPKEYPSYEEYRKAMLAYEHFLEIVEKVEKAFECSKTDEDLYQQLLALGFTSVEDNECIS